MPTQNLYAVKDVHIANHSSGGWYMYQAGTHSNLWLGCWDWPEYANYTRFYAYQSRALMQFSIPSLGAEDTVISAKLRVPLSFQKGINNPRNAPYYSETSAFTVNVHKVTQDWDEGTGDGYTDGRQYTGATWTNRKANGYGWSSYGGYFNSTPVASLTQDKNAYWWEFDVTSLVKEWIASPTTNYGLILKYANDTTPNGSHYTWSRNIGAGDWGPYIEFTYNSPPEEPRGLAPNFGGFVCMDLAHTMEFKWTFLDTAAPIARGKADVMFIVDVSGSMSSMWSRIRTQISNYVDRMTNEQVDWQVGLIAYSDVNRGEPINKWGWFKDKTSLLSAYDSMPKYSGGDYPESGLEAILDPSRGAKSFVWRPNSQGQIMVCTDAPFHNKSGVDTYYVGYSQYELTDATNWINSMGIKCSVATNTHCGSYTQLRVFPTNTGGQYLEESSNWGDYLNVLSIRSADEALRFDEGDYQTKAELRIFKTNADGTKTQIWGYTHNSGEQSLFVKGLGVAWEEGGAYEWDVRVFDRYGVPSPWSDRAPFAYIIDVNAAIGVPMFSEPLTIGTTVNRKALTEIKDKLYYEVRKYSNLDPGITETLFTTDVVPTRSDVNKVAGLINGMRTSDGLNAISTDLVGDSFGVSDITNMRDRITEAAMSPPDNPTGGVATRSNGVVRPPVSIVATHTSNTDRNMVIKWTPAEATGAGWNVALTPVTDTDINYYKIYREETMNLTNKVKKILTEVYLTTEQVQGGNIFIPDTGRVDADRIVYRPHDMNGRTSVAEGAVTLNTAAASGGVPTVVNYTVEYQQRSWNAVEADPKGTWYPIYTASGRSFTHYAATDGSYWYRVRALLSNGQYTGWTYTQNIVYVRT